MKRNFVVVAGGALLSFVVLSGCGDPGSSDEPADDAQDLTGGISGYYELASDPNNDTWIEAISLDSDHTFTANMGNDVSNLSGHHFPASGTYAVDKKAGKTILTLTTSIFAGPTTSWTYDLDVRGSQLGVTDTAQGAKPFTMKKTKLVTLTFGDDWSATQSGPLVVGAPLLVRYAASRDKCSPPQDGGVWVSMLASIDHGIPVGLTDEFGDHPVHGNFTALGTVPVGKDLAIWFQTGAMTHEGRSTCAGWDSHFGQNYHFTINPS